MKRNFWAQLTVEGKWQSGAPHLGYVGGGKNSWELRDNSTTSSGSPKSNSWVWCLSFFCKPAIGISKPSSSWITCLAILMLRPLPPINNNQIWRSQTVTLYSTIAPANDFSHTRIVVWPDYGLDFILTVIFLTRFAVDKDNHGWNRTGPHDIRVIEGFDADWGRYLEQTT